MKRRMFLAAAVALAAVVCRGVFSEPAAPGPRPAPEKRTREAPLPDRDTVAERKAFERRREAAWGLAERRIAAAEQEALRRAHLRAREVRERVEGTKAGAPALAGALLSLSAKGAWLQEFVGYQPKGRFLEKQFGTHLFTAAELEEVAAEALDLYAEDLDEVEGELLVNLYADLDLPPGKSRAPGEPGALEAALAQRVRGLRGPANGYLGLDTVRMAVSIGVSELLHWALRRAGVLQAARLGRSVAILGSGAGGTVKSLGISIVLAVAVDAALEKAVDALYDPKGKLAAELGRVVDDVARLLVEGEGPECPGLRAALEAAGRERAAAWRRALRPVVVASVR